MKSSNDLIMNRTRYPPAYDTVPQPAAPPRTSPPPPPSFETSETNYPATRHHVIAQLSVQVGMLPPNPSFSANK